jgi:hypothetical protein
MKIAPRSLEREGNSMDMPTTKRPLGRKAASDYLKERHGVRCEPATLAKYASIGGGPRYRKSGRFPIYEPEDLDIWAAARTSRPVNSTAELQPGSAPDGSSNHRAA